MANEKSGSWKSSQWYSDKRLSGVPRYWEPGGRNAGTHLAYITDEEIDVLKRQAKRNNIDLVEHKGPKGVPFFASSLMSVNLDNTSEEVTKSVPVRWKSSPEHPVANLVYVTGAQAKLLKRLDIHGSGVDKHDHYGPDNVPSYQGDGGGGDGGSDGGGSGDGGGSSDSGGSSDTGSSDTGDDSGAETGVSTDTSGATSAGTSASTSGASSGLSAESLGAPSMSATDMDVVGAALATGASAMSATDIDTATDAIANALASLSDLSSAEVGQGELDAIAAAAAAGGQGKGFSLSNITAKDLAALALSIKSGGLAAIAGAFAFGAKASGNPGLAQAGQIVGIAGSLGAGQYGKAVAGALGVTGLGNLSLGEIGAAIGSGIGAIGTGGTGVAGGTGGDTGGIGVDSGTATAGGTTAGGTTAGGAKGSTTSPGGDLGLLLALLGGAGAGAMGTSSSGETAEDSAVPEDPLIPFDWSKPLQTTPFATPKMASKESLDELLGILQHRG